MIERKNYSTYAQLFLSFRESVGELFSGTGISKPSTDTLLGLKKISNSEIRQTLDDPHNQDVRAVMKLQAGNIELDRNIIQLKDELSAQKIFIDESLKSLNTLSKQKDLPPTAKTTYKNAAESLENQYKQLNAIESLLNQNIKTRGQLEQKIDQMGKEQKTERDNYRRDTLKEIAGEFDKMKLGGEKMLNEDEMNEFLRQDSWDDLVKRFQQLNVEWPKHIDKKAPSSSAYFELKSYLAIRSSLSRNFQPHHYEDIMSHMKNLNASFKRANEKGEAIYKRQEEAAQSTLKNEVKPVVDSLKRNHSTLSGMKAQRDALLKVVTPEQTLRSIQQETQKRIAETIPVRPQGPR